MVKYVLNFLPIAESRPGMVSYPPRDDCYGVILSPTGIGSGPLVVDVPRDEGVVTLVDGVEVSSFEYFE